MLCASYQDIFEGDLKQSSEEDICFRHRNSDSRTLKKIKSNEVIIVCASRCRYDLSDIINNMISIQLPIITSSSLTAKCSGEQGVATSQIRISIFPFQ